MGGKAGNMGGIGNRPGVGNWKPPGGFGQGSVPPQFGGEPGPGFNRPMPIGGFNPHLPGRDNKPDFQLPPGMKPENPIAWNQPGNNGGSVSVGPQPPGGNPGVATYFPGGERPGTYGVPGPGINDVVMPPDGSGKIFMQGAVGSGNPVRRGPVGNGPALLGNPFRRGR